MRIDRAAVLASIGGWALILFSIWTILSAGANVRSDVLATYDRFVSAQNARDLGRVREALLDSPDFLWVSDGKSVWGRDALIERMGRFQALEIWRAEPLLDRARIVEVTPDAAYLHMPLDLHLGTHAAPSVTRFLVSILMKRTADGWRIAALFTTLDNPS